MQREPHIIEPDNVLTLAQPGGLGSLVVRDDSALWLAWETAKERWLDNLQARSGRMNTRNTYECAYRQFFVFARSFAAVEPWRVSPGLVQEWMSHMRQEKRYSESTVALKLAVLSSFYKFVITQYSFTRPDGRSICLWPWPPDDPTRDKRNPFQTVDRPQIDPYSRAVYPSIDEVKAMLELINTDCLTGRRDFALFWTILTTCRRFSEIINLTWGDITERPDGHYNIRYIYKGGKPRRAKLPKACFQAICAYLEMDGRPPDEMREGNYIFVPMRPERSGHLPTVDAETIDPNRPISNTQANRSLKKYARRAGIDEKYAHIHALRHAGARMRRQRMTATGRNVDYEELMLILGHKSIATTYIYTKTVLEDPKDPGAEDAATQWLPTQRRRRKQGPPPPEQDSFLGGD